MSVEFSFQYVNQIEQIGKPAWSSLMGQSNPFTRYDFLHSLEVSGCVGGASGWQPMHVKVTHAGQSVAVMPLYLKTHSYGEYVFDWAWAQAYARHQLDYYPKLVSAIPFTPVCGKRIAIAPSVQVGEQTLLLQQLSHYLDGLLDKLSASGWHNLFYDSEAQQKFRKASHLTRLGTQFHWHNRGYSDFNDFVATMSSRKRKNILKERRQLDDKGLSFRFVKGEDVTESDLLHFVACYQATYDKRSGHSGYLNHAFFSQLLASMADAILLLIVEQQTSHGVIPIAAALYFTSATTLYGRYWGSLVEMDGLHFETCYYQGIDYAITHGVQIFDAGAQGEHKVLRGFEPVATYSAHEIKHPGFRVAIEDFTQQERQQINHYMAQLRKVLPYKKGD